MKCLFVPKYKQSQITLYKFTVDTSCCFSSSNAHQIHYMSCLYGYGNKVILSYVISYIQQFHIRERKTPKKVNSKKGRETPTKTKFDRYRWSYECSYGKMAFNAYPQWHPKMIFTNYSYTTGFLINIAGTQKTNVIHAKYSVFSRCHMSQNYDMNSWLRTCCEVSCHLLIARQKYA